MELQGEMGHKDTLVPSLRGIPISKSLYPKTFDTDWIAPNAVLIGDIKMGEGSSAWHGATLRGDLGQIRIGKNTMLQDNSYVRPNNNASVNIGDNVYVGPNARLEACHLESFSYVGMGASVAKDCVVESFSVVAAGANLAEGTRVPSGQIYAGSPA